MMGHAQSAIAVRLLPGNPRRLDSYRLSRAPNGPYPSTKRGP
jgi:hypothetical protein